MLHILTFAMNKAKRHDHLLHEVREGDEQAQRYQVSFGNGINHTI